MAHRVVHGGNTLARSCVIDAGVEREIERLSALAPPHNPLALAWLRACRTVGPSMGFSPLEGLVMATCSGDVDAGLLLYLQSVECMSPEQPGRLLNEASGLPGLSGMSGDMRTLLESSDPAARAAVL